ncbi:MAG: ChaN family lipoprotein [Rhodospirillaceae bacterium]|nr:ChaN family lipoprotein [Rhodospirillaceae bacterium]
MKRETLKWGAVTLGAAIGLATLGACAPVQKAAPAKTAAQAAAPVAAPALPITLGDLTDFALLYTDGGKQPARQMSVAEAADILKNYDVIFIGEEHRHPGNHIAEMALYRAIQERAPKTSLSLEQFERDVQNVIDDFMAGKIGETPMRDAARAWDNYPVSYRPLVEYAKARSLPVIAAEVPGSVVRCVGERGPEFLDTMKPEQRGWAAAQLHITEGAYKDKYMKFAAGDGSHGEDTAKDKNEKKAPNAAALRSFAAQVTRDDTMAESIYLHLQKNPGNKVVHLNGSFHSESFLGTAERLQMRDPKLKIAVVNPVQVKLGGKLEVNDEQAKTGTFVLLIGQSPKTYASMDEMKAAITKQMSFRGKNKCEL